MFRYLGDRMNFDSLDEGETFAQAFCNFFYSIKEQIFWKEKQMVLKVNYYKKDNGVNSTT